MSRVAAIVLAAGRSSRMGRDKLGIPFGGSTLLERAVAPFLSCRGIAEVIVVVRPDRALPAGLSAARAVRCAGADAGMGASLAAGVAAAAEADIYLLSLGDKPEIRAETVSAVLSAALGEGGAGRTPGIAIPVFAGQRGHPVAISARYRSDLLALGGDVGAREIAAAHPEDVLEVEVDDAGILRDVDVPEDLRAATERKREEKRV